MFKLLEIIRKNVRDSWGWFAKNYKQLDLSKINVSIMLLFVLYVWFNDECTCMNGWMDWLMYVSIKIITN